MEFKFENQYDQKSLTAMCRVLRKTVRKKRSRRVHILGWLVIALALLLMLSEKPFVWNGNDTVNVITIAAILAVKIWEDSLNAWIAKKRTLPGLTKSTVVFTEEHYHSVTEMGESQFYYDKVTHLAETKAYFVFMFGKNHGQVYDKATLTGGTLEEFRQFIEQKTGKTIQTIK